MNTVDSAFAPQTLRSHILIEQVLEKLGWPDWLELNQHEEAEYLSHIKENLKVESPDVGRDSTRRIVKISYAHTDRDRSSAFLKMISEVWQKEENDKESVAEADLLKELRRRRLAKRNEESELRKAATELRAKNNIPSSFGSGRGGYVIATDPIHAQLFEQEEQLIALEIETEEAQSKLAGQRRKHATMPDKVPVEVQESEGVTNERAIADLRTAIQANREKQSGLKPLHSEYVLLQNEIDEMQEKITQFQETQFQAVVSEHSIPNPDRKDLGKQIDEADAVLSMTLSRKTALAARIGEIGERIINLTEAYSELDAIDSEMNRVAAELEVIVVQEAEKESLVARIEGGGGTFSEFDRPRTSERPLEPDPLMIVLFSVFAGLGLGLALAVMKEYSKNCFRSMGDISRVMVAPVLGSVNLISTRAEVRRLRIGRMVVGCFTLAFVGGVGYLTWAWSVEPASLSPMVRDSIESLRESLK